MTALTITNLTKTYSTGVKALQDVNLRVMPGEFFGLLGPNGAGKSTLIGIISSLVTKTQGEVELFGFNLTTQPGLAKASLGLVPQEFNFNIFEKVLRIVVTQAGYYGIPEAVALERAEFYLKKLGLWEKRNQSARQLSGGMKRRLLIARALLHQPKLLILDEPTAGVDIELRRSMWEFLQELNQQGTTIILTTHYLEEAESLCKRIAIINKGQIIEDTDTKTLLQKLDTETFILNLQSPLEQAPAIAGYHLQWIDETTLTVDVRRGQNLNQLFSSLSAQQIIVTSLRNKANRLEELFVRLVQGNHTFD